MLCLKTQQKTNLNHSLHCHDTKFKLPVCHTVLIESLSLFLHADQLIYFYGYYVMLYFIVRLMKRFLQTINNIKYLLVTY